MLFRAIAFFCFGLLTCSAAPVWEPKEKETVVLLGDTFFERDYNYGLIETALTIATAGKQIRFRNLGWSGDTPRCESRSYFGPPAEGFDRLRKQLAEIKPTTVIACYGGVDAFQGEAGITSFLKSYSTLLAMIRETPGVTVILVTPPAASNDVQRWPSLKGHLALREMYAKAITDFGKEQQLPVADLFSMMKNESWKTINGVTLTEEDYQKVAPLVAKALGLEIQPKKLAQPSLKETIIAKNRLFFQRWRPQNEIYLFGSRKHEQGKNGAEIPTFDPLIAEKETLIFGTFPSSR